MEDLHASSDDECYLDGRDSDFEDFFPDFGSASASTSTSASVESEDLRKIMDVLSLKEHHARTLLINYCWDVDKIMTILVDRDKDYLFLKAGVPILEDKDPVTPELSSIVKCFVCLEDVASGEITTMDCGHYFCNTCWTQHFVVSIYAGLSKRVTCMSHGCNTVCNEAKIRTLVNIKCPKLVEKFDRFLLESYIEDNKKVKWCPSIPHCGNAIHYNGDDLCEVECACGLTFCFECLSEPHSPCPCLIGELWSQKCRDESETMNWIKVNAKPCPLCHRPVQKNKGCDHVRCICQQSFCWVCGEATGLMHTLTDIVGHKCKGFAEAQKASSKKAGEQLERYSHCYDRHKAHIDSLVLENKLKETIEKKASWLKEQDLETLVGQQMASIDS